MNIDPLSWPVIARYLDPALDLEPGPRAAWLDELERTQAAIARSIRELLAERDALNASGFLAGAPFPLTRLDTVMPSLVELLRQTGSVESEVFMAPDQQQQDAIEPGAVLGPYRLLREIGYGGMSQVWLAERCDGQFNREVALKLPFRGPYQAQMAERFKRERDILAGLTHPNIARLYDAGISALGQSYLAMEYVHGTALTQYCDRLRLTVRQRLTLFLQVLDAVEFAHTHLVLHRDLKPSNIQVTDAGRVVLLDFGIAKLLSPEPAPDSPLTEMEARMLTVDYASPEHLAGHALWTTSDVYSLGVVLFELLAGARPFGARDESRRQIEEAILTRDPPRPSQLQLSEEIAAARNTVPRKLAQALRGDLDTIVLKALKKAPADRYRSIEAFAGDIANHLNELPVSARPDSAWYRMQRFVSRNKWQVAGTLVASLSIVAAAGTAVWQAGATARQRDRALVLASRNRAINDFTSMLIGESASSEKPVTVKEMLDRSERLAMAGIVGDSGDQAAVLETIATLRMYAGDTDKASQAFERAAALAAAAGEAGMKSRLTCLYATTLSNMGKIEEARNTIARELEHLEFDDQNAAECFAAFATVVQRDSDADGVLRYGTLALERFHRSGLKWPAKEAALLSLVAVGYAMHGDNARANDYYEMSLRKFQQAGREHSPVALVVLSNWAVVTFGSGAPKRALDLYDQVLSVLTARDPDATPPVFVLNNHARMLLAIGRFDQARSEYLRTLQLAQRSKNVFFEASVLIDLASVAQQSGDIAAATGYFRQLDESLGPALSKYGMLMTPRELTQGRIDLAEGKLDAARAQFDGVLDRARAKNTRNGGVCYAYLGKAEADLLSGDAAAAVANARAAVQLAVSLQGGIPYSDVTGRASLMLGRALKVQGDLAPAHDALETAVRHLSNTVDADHPELIRARELLAATSDPNLL